LRRFEQARRLDSIPVARAGGGDYRSHADLDRLGWAQNPHLITPDITIYNSSARATTLRLLIIALLLGTIVLFPSLAFLYYIFKGKDS
jgi:hypothetical protein